MTPVVFKTIWQCQEINQIGDQPCTEIKLLPEVPEVPPTAEPQPKMDKLRMFVKRKKAVSFHGVETCKADDSMQWHLQLKRSSACTNVSALNLAEVDNETPESETTEEGLGLASENLVAFLQREPDSEEENAMETGLSERLMKAKDSISDLTKRSANINQHMKILESECAALCENLELRHQEAEELEAYCNKLEETCQKVSKSVEDAEKKVSMLKDNSLILEEKLNSLQEEMRQHELGSQESKQQETKTADTATYSKEIPFSPADLPKATASSEDAWTKEIPFSPAGLPRATASSEDAWTGALSKAISLMVTSIVGLQHSCELETQRIQPAAEAVIPGIEEIKMLTSTLNQIREGLEERHHKEILSHNEVLRIITHLCSCFDLFLPQWERAQMEQVLIIQSLQELQSNTDNVSTNMKRISTSFSQLQKDMDTLWQVKPLIEDVSRQLSGTKGFEMSEHSMLGLTGCSSTSLVTTENLKQTMEEAMIPLLEEIKLFNQHTCTSCQQLQKKILELERHALETHMQMVVLRSDLRVVHDDALRLQNILSHRRLKTEEKVDLEDIYLKMYSMQEKLRKLSAEQQSPVKEADEALESCRSCPDGNVQNSSSVSLN
uniref:Testis-specific serine kinase substrate n=1 Tax=Geotrypetes seraphini TaxID=260995 RepID=A0A6P8SUB5_GEOSA|nr:testis-specific serine kinase substrate [Geotrypetes seraphini]